MSRRVIQTVCASCKYEANHIDWPSSESFAFRTLETRLPEDSHILENQLLVKTGDKCDRCGKLLKEDFNVDRLIKSDIYQKQLNNIEFPQKANQLLCESIILENSLDFNNAVWASLYAAWICDDNEKYVQSKYCRNRTIELFFLAGASNSGYFLVPGRFGFLLAELFRRTEQFDYASRICEIHQGYLSDEILNDIYQYQFHLLSVEDIKAHDIQDALLYCDYYATEYEDEYDYEYDDRNDYDDFDSDSYYFDAMTDGQLGDYDDFIERGGNIDDIETWARG